MPTFAPLSVVTSGLMHFVFSTDRAVVRCRAYIGMGGQQDKALRLYTDFGFAVEGVIAVAGTQVRDIGRIYCFCLTANDDIIVAYSDDDGENWALEVPQGT